MLNVKTIAATALLAVGLTGVATAATEHGMAMFRDGRMRTIEKGSKMDKMLMPYAKQIDSDMVYMSGGHFYSVPNVRMPDGSMLYDSLMSPSSPNYEPNTNR